MWCFFERSVRRRELGSPLYKGPKSSQTLTHFLLSHFGKSSACHGCSPSSMMQWHSSAGTILPSLGMVQRRQPFICLLSKHIWAIEGLHSVPWRLEADFARKLRVWSRAVNTNSTIYIWGSFWVCVFDTKAPQTTLHIKLSGLLSLLLFNVWSQ